MIGIVVRAQNEAEPIEECVVRIQQYGYSPRLRREAVEVEIGQFAHAGSVLNRPRMLGAAPVAQGWPFRLPHGKASAPAFAAFNNHCRVPAISANDNLRRWRSDHAALEKAGVQARHIVMLGDTPYGIEAARRTGVRTLAVRCPNGRKPGFGVDRTRGNLSSSTACPPKP